MGVSQRQPLSFCYLDMPIELPGNINFKHMTMKCYDNRKDEQMLTLVPLPAGMAFAFELNVGNPHKDLFLW